MAKNKKPDLTCIPGRGVDLRSCLPDRGGNQRRKVRRSARLSVVPDCQSSKERQQAMKCCDGVELCDKCRAELDKLHESCMAKVDEFIAKGERRE